MSAPRSRSFFTSSLSPLEQAAKNTHPSWNLTLFELGLGLPDSLFVSESSQRFNCWCLRNKALTCFPSSAMFVCNLPKSIERHLSAVTGSSGRPPIMDGMSSLRKLCFAHFRLLRLSADSNLQRRTFYREAAICQRNRQEKGLAEEIGTFFLLC